VLKWDPESIEKEEEKIFDLKLADNVSKVSQAIIKI